MDLLSPGLDYHGLHTRAPAAKYGHRPILLVASEGDASSAKATEELAQVAGPRASVKIVAGRAHGTRMIEQAPQIVPLVVEFFRKSL